MLLKPTSVFSLDLLRNTYCLRCGSAKLINSDWIRLQQDLNTEINQEFKISQIFICLCGGSWRDYLFWATFSLSRWNSSLCAVGYQLSAVIRPNAVHGGGWNTSPMIQIHTKALGDKTIAELKEKPLRAVFYLNNSWFAPGEPQTAHSHFTCLVTHWAATLPRWHPHRWGAAGKHSHPKCNIKLKDASFSNCRSNQQAGVFVSHRFSSPGGWEATS